jgi:anti-anti-sigma factor
LEDFEKIIVDDVIVAGVNLTRATINEAVPFRKIVEEAINSGHTNLVIDLGKCDFIDSAFFGVIIIALKMMTSKDYKLKLVQPAIPGEDIFTNRNLTRLFDLYETREDAIKSFKHDTQP